MINEKGEKDPSWRGKHKNSTNRGSRIKGHLNWDTFVLVQTTQLQRETETIKTWFRWEFFYFYKIKNKNDKISSEQPNATNYTKWNLFSLQISS